MCLALPMRVVELIDAQTARVELDGVDKTISIALLDGVRIGDYLVTHVGYALARLDPDEAERTLAAFAAPLRQAAAAGGPQTAAQASTNADRAAQRAAGLRA